MTPEELPLYASNEKYELFHNLKMKILNHGTIKKKNIKVKDSSLGNSNISNIQLDNAKFYDVDMQNSVFKFCNIRNSKFVSTNLGRSILQNIIFYNVTFMNVDFSYATLSNIIFINCTFEDCNKYRSCFKENISFYNCVPNEVEKQIWS